MTSKPYNLLKWPDPRLQMVCDPVPLQEPGSEFFKYGSELHVMLDRMWTTLDLFAGYGLAAPQIGSPSRVIIAYVPGGCKMEIINPVVIREWGGKFLSDEGCLSYPDRRVRIMRYRRIKVSGLDRFGEPVVFGGKNLRAACLQHEIEHLDGITLADHDLGYGAGWG